MAMVVYTPNDVDIIHNSRVDFRKRITQQLVHLVQYERSLPVVEVELFYNGYSYTCPNTAEVYVRWGKKDHTYVYKKCQVSSDRKKVYFDVDYQMTYYPGELNPILELKIAGKSAGSSVLPVTIDRNPIQEEDRESQTEDEQIDELEQKVDEHIANKNNPHAVTKSQIGLSNVDNTSDINKPVSTAQQVALDTKADKSTTYTKVETDNLLNQKVDKIAGKGLSTNDFTNDYKDAVDANTLERHSHSNKALLDTYTQTNENLADAVSKKHSHSNKDILDVITAAYLTSEKTKLSNIESYAQVNILEGVQVNGIDLTITSKKVNIDLTPYATITTMETYGKSLVMSINPTTYVITLSLVDKNGNTLSTQTVDLPLETVVVGGSYNAQNEALVLTLNNGQTISIPVSSLISGLVSETSLATTLQSYYTKTQVDNLLSAKQNTIDTTHKLSSDLVDDTNHTNKFVTAQQIQDISDNKSARHSHANKALLDTYNQTNADIADAISKKHSHSNKALLDTYDQTNANLTDAVSKKHSHNNKAILDAITVAFTDSNYVHTDNNYTSAEKTKLSGIASGAQVNILEGIQVNGTDVAIVNKKSNVILAESVTYAELTALINNNSLVAGRIYRIIDYVTTTAQARTRSAGHQFDILVKAISTNELSEDASACLHSGDTYFANSNLKAWVLKYSINNDTSRYAWADVTTGKGVIYYMKDEFYNECGYDFKNIQFARYKVTACANCPELVGWHVGVLDYNGNAILTNYMTLDTSDYEYFYTFDCCNTDYSLNAVGTTLTRPDGSTFELNQIQCCRCLIGPDENDAELFYLNNFVMMLQSSRDAIIRMPSWVQHTTVLGGASNIEVSTISKVIIGAKPNGYIDGYGFGACDINDIADSLICCGFTRYAIYNSKIGNIRSSCLISNYSCIYLSSVVAIGNSTLIATNTQESYCVLHSNVTLVLNCNLKATNSIIIRSHINVIRDCTCTVSGVLVFCGYSTIVYLASIQMASGEYSDVWVISYCRIGDCYNNTIKSIRLSSLIRLTNSSLTNVITGCTFKTSAYLICSQKLTGCNFEYNTSYLEISSQTTTQTITNTNFHDIAGTDADHVKSVVIPEDYSTVHTVDIYARGHVIREID